MFGEIKKSQITPNGSQCGLVASVLDCDILISLFELQSRNYIYFRTNILGKATELSYPLPKL